MQAIANFLPTVMLITALSLFPFEYFFSRKIQNARKSQKFENIFLLFFNEKIVSEILTLFQFYALLFVTKKLHIGAEFHILSGLPTPFGFLIAFILFDAHTYYIHLLLHRNNFLWQIHKLHHSATTMDFTVDWRYSWYETFIFFMLNDLVLLTLGVSEATLMQIHTVTSIYSMFIHSNVNFKMPFLSKFMTTPHYHLWHHSKECKWRYGQNFAAIFTIWDHLQKRFYYTDEAPEELGFDDEKAYPQSIFLKIIFPFNKLINK